MHVLLTRPGAESGQLARRLEQDGHQTSVSPVLEIIRRAAIPAMPDCDAVVVASARVFTDAAIAGRATNWNVLPVYCVGQGTAAAARHAGFEQIAAVAPTAHALLALIAASLPAPARLLYLAGKDRKPLLENRLQASGHDVRTIVIYEAAASAALSGSAQTALKAGRIDAILHFSRRSAEIFAQLALAAGVADHAAACRHICISADTALGLQNLPGASADIATSPDTEAVLACVNRIAN